MLFASTKKGKRGRHITVDIPQHYISTLLRRYDISFPFEFIPYPMEATWNGVDELNHIPVKYDYAVLKMGKNLPVDNQTDMKDIKVYFQSKSWLVPQSTIILESSDPICNGLIFFYKNGNNQKQIELNEQTIELQGKYYTGITIENTLDLKEAIIKISTKNYDE